MKNYILEIFNTLLYVLAILQTNEVFQIIEFVVSIVVSIILLVYRIWKWWKEANKDGKITKDEIEDGINIVIGGVDEIKDKIDKDHDDANKS